MCSDDSQMLKLDMFNGLTMPTFIIFYLGLSYFPVIIMLKININRIFSIVKNTG